MKLIDKIQKAHSNKPSDYSRVYTPTAEIIEKIADDYAIEFAEWNSYKYKYLPNKGWFRGSYELEMDIFKTSKELLEIFKKEKGL
jgi:hypothetical protein